MFDRYCLGVDVSSWQTTVDWKKLYKAGVRFAIIKAAQGKYKQDPICPSHLKEAKAAGMICGVYHWMDPADSRKTRLTISVTAWLVWSMNFSPWMWSNTGPTGMNGKPEGFRNAIRNA